MLKRECGIPSARATCRASSTASLPQQLPKRCARSSASRGQTRMVTPMTSAPCSTSSAAATDESTPPLMPTTMRSAICFSLVPRAEQLGQALELVRRRVADLDLTLSLVADDPHARHQAALQRFLERRELDRPPPSLA